MEPTEVGEFAKEMKEAGEASMTYVSLAISILAVLVAMVTVLGHRSHTEAVLEQSRAADQWNLYQAKKIRQGQDTNTVVLLSLQPNSNGDAVEKQIEEYKKHNEKTNDDLKEEQAKAHELEDSVAKAERAAAKFDLGEALLQIAVVLSSITLLTRQRLYFFMGIALGVAGAVVATLGLLVH